MSERRDIVNFFEEACGPTISLTVKTEFTKLPSVSFELLIFDASLIVGKTKSFYRCLDLFSDKLICLLPFDSPEDITDYVESHFTYIISFPISVDAFKTSFIRITGKLQSCKAGEHHSLSDTESIPDTVSGCFCGNSRIIKSIRKQILRVAETREPVLLLGETGTGKSTAAKLIHKLTFPKGKEMVTCPISTVNESLAGSTFFGHVKGAFTGADEDRIGDFEAADGTSLFLDELGIASLDVQAMLLTVLDTGDFKKVGSEKVQHADVRMIFATNADINRLIREGKFREELYYRINHHTINLPPLRDRKEDIADIVESYISQNDFLINQDALELIEDYDWPGNIRQLQSCLRRAMWLVKSQTGAHMICAEHIDFGDLNSLQ